MFVSTVKLAATPWQTGDEGARLDLSCGAMEHGHALFNVVRNSIKQQSVLLDCAWESKRHLRDPLRCR